METVIRGGVAPSPSQPGSLAHHTTVHHHHHRWPDFASFMNYASPTHPGYIPAAGSEMFPSYHHQHAHQVI